MIIIVFIDVEVVCERGRESHVCSCPQAWAKNLSTKFESRWFHRAVLDFTSLALNLKQWWESIYSACKMS